MLPFRVNRPKLDNEKETVADKQQKLESEHLKKGGKTLEKVLKRTKQSKIDEY